MDWQAIAIAAAMLLGYLMGWFVHKGITRKRKTQGTLVIKAVDEDGPYLFLELKDNLNTVISQKDILFEIRADLAELTDPIVKDK